MYKVLPITGAIKVYLEETRYDPETETLTWFEWQIDDYREYVYDGFLDLLSKMEWCGYELVNVDEWDDAEFELDDFKFKKVVSYPHWKIDKPLSLQTVIDNVAIKVSLKIPLKWFKRK